MVTPKTARSGPQRARKSSYELSAQKKGLLAADPTERVRGFRQAAPEETPHTALELDALREFLASIGTRTLKDLRDTALLMVLARLGLRREEASQLDWSEAQALQLKATTVVLASVSFHEYDLPLRG